MTEPKNLFSSNEIQESLAQKIDIPDECICAYVRIEPYHLVQRKINPDCTAHTPDDDGELSKERD